MAAWKARLLNVLIRSTNIEVETWYKYNTDTLMQHRTQISTAGKTQLVMRPETEVFLGSNYTEYQTAHRSTCSLSRHNASRTFTSTSRWHKRNSKGIEPTSIDFNPLKPELNSICYLLALLAHHFLHVCRIRVKSLTFRRLMSYIWSTYS